LYSPILCLPHARGWIYNYFQFTSAQVMFWTIFVKLFSSLQLKSLLISNKLSVEFQGVRGTRKNFPIPHGSKGNFP